MTRLELLKLVIGRARSNGFEFRKWYTGRLGMPWISAEAAINLLESQRRYYALLFSHEFAQNFWKAGADITFEVPAASFTRVLPDGSTKTIERKSFIRRSSRPDTWRYHLREMADAEEPLRYIRKFLPVEDDLIEDDLAAATAENVKPKPTRRELKAAAPARTREKPLAKPVPTGLPPFLQRPYR